MYIYIIYYIQYYTYWLGGRGQWERCWWAVRDTINKTAKRQTHRKQRGRQADKQTRAWKQGQLESIMDEQFFCVVAFSCQPQLCMHSDRPSYSHAISYSQILTAPGVPTDTPMCRNLAAEAETKGTPHNPKASLEACRTTCRSGHRRGPDCQATNWIAKTIWDREDMVQQCCWDCTSSMDVWTWEALKLHWMYGRNGRKHASNSCDKK